MGDSLWLSGFFPQPTWRSQPSTDFDAKWLKRRVFTKGRAFWSKNRNFFKPLTPRPRNPPKFAQFWLGQNFRLISRLTFGVSRVNTPYSALQPNKSVIVNRQCGGGKFKYVPKFCIEVQVTWYRACTMTICTGQALWRPISRKLLEIEAWSQWSTNRINWCMRSRMVTWPMTSRDLERSRSWLVTQLSLGPIISKWAGDRGFVTMEHQ